MAYRFPGLLDASLAETCRLSPVSGSLTLRVKGAHEASMTLPEDAPAVKIHDWISVYNGRGFVGFFRVTNAAPAIGQQIDLTLLHGIDILSDSVWRAQIDFSGTRAEYLAAILNQQTQLIGGVKPWVPGTCDDTSAVKRTINYDRLSVLLEEMEEDGGSYYFTYDQTVFPWVLNYVAKPSGVASEFRLSRNVISAPKITYNDADMCTCLILSNNRRSQDSDTGVTSNDSEILTYNNAAAQAEYGVIVKTADIDTDDDVKNHAHAEADAWAQKFMAERAAPSVQIQIEGEELYAITGDTWDEHDIGKICRVALPDYGHTFEERVVSVTYPELFNPKGNPDRITVSLANTLPRFSESIASAQKAAAAAGAGARRVGRMAADAKEVTSWSQVVKYQGAALDGTGVTTLYESGIDLDATGGATIYSLVEGLQALYGGIQVEAGRISLLVSGSGNQASIRIDAIVDEINNSGSSVTIDASKIYLNGQVIANSINAVSLALEALKTGTATATLINVEALTTTNGGTVSAGTLYGNSVSIGSGASGGSGTLYFRGAQYYRQGLTLGGTGGSIAEAHFLGDSSTTVNLDHYHTITATEGTGADAGKIIITLGAPSASEGSTNFNIAATTAYQNGVLAARNAVKVSSFTADARTGGTLNDHRTFTYITDAPTPDPAGKQEDTWYLAGGTSWDSSHKSSVGLHYGNASGTRYASLEVDASGVYFDGVLAGEAEFTQATVTPQGSQVSVTPVSHTSAIRINDTLATLYEAGSVTKTDRGSAVTAYEKLTSGGTLYYKAGTAQTYYQAGTAVTRYQAGTAITRYTAGTPITRYSRGSAVTRYKAGTTVTRYKGNGGAFTVQGNSVSVTTCGRKWYYIWHDSSETPTGSYYTRQATQPASGSYIILYEADTTTPYYEAGTQTVYARGDSEQITQQGEAETIRPAVDAETITPIGDAETITPIGTEETITPVGSPVSVTPVSHTSAIRINDTAQTLYDGAGGSFTVQGSGVSAYRKLTSGGMLYYQAAAAQTYYQAGTPDSTTYYTRSA